MFKIDDSVKSLIKQNNFDDIYDYYRLVDPILNVVYEYKNNELCFSDCPMCFKAWKRKAPCSNCISIRACNENKKYVKIEYVNNTVYFVTAKPVVVNNKKLSLELISDVTDSLYLSDNSHKDNTEITTIIKEMNELIVKDSFTNLYNNKFIKSKIQYLAENKAKFSLMSMDVDNFREINSNYGHLAGDMVVEFVGEKLNDLNSNADILSARPGGDEFIVVFIGYDEADVNDICSVIKDEIENHIFEFKGEKFAIEYSMAIGEYSPNESHEDFMLRIDKAMYKQKNSKKMKEKAANEQKNKM